MIQSYDIVIILLLFIFNLLLGFFVLLNNPRKAINRTFFGFILFVTVWIISAFTSEFVPSDIGKIFLSKMTMAGAIVAFAFFFFFSFYFPIEKKIKNYITIAVSLIAGIFALAILATNVLINGLVHKPWGFDLTYNSIGFNAFMALFLSLVIVSVINLILNYRKSNRLNKQQLQYLFFGFSLFVISIIFFDILMPQLTGGEMYYKFGSYSVVFFIGFTTYAIVKHRLMDIRMVVARSVAYSLIIATLAAFYAGAIFAANALIFPGSNPTDAYIAYQAFLGLLMALTFQPLRRFVTRITDKVFFKNQYDQGQLLDDISHKIGETIILVELLYKTLDLLISQMKVSRGIFVILSDEGTIYNVQAAGYKDLPKAKTEDVVKMAKDGVLVYDELEESAHYKHLLRKYDAAVSIPLKTENTTEGILLLGEKSSGDMFSVIDLRVFEIIAPELAIAITNAKAYERIEKFNITLRQEVKKATSELEQKNEQLRELDKAKDEFISMASHQLRTPLTAIKGYLSMLLEGDAGEIKVSQYDFVNEAFSGANRMVGLINDLLNVSRMETGRFFLEPVEVDLERVAQEEIKQLDNHAKEKKLYLKFEKKGKVPKIWADETKIRQVIMNFIDNALYYTTKGGVTVTLSTNAKDVKLEVTDTGIGVPKAQQANLFTKFYRADNARHVRPDGTGLGIYLAKRVIVDHGGEIIFHSQEGKGSTFGFKFPIKSNLKIKRVSAPAPTTDSEDTSAPPIGELAAGIGVPAEALKASEAENIEDKSAGRKGVIAAENKKEPLKVGETKN